MFTILEVAAGALAVGLALGVWLEARLWREKGDHSFMNVHASGGHRYTVKRLPSA